MLLADMGAEVVRIQRPGGADPYAPGLATRDGRAQAAVSARLMTSRCTSLVPS
jgi:crotonobetainyl-CoA:carnitine CoA-transferase CaiB-like acyl-CoA transferase